MLGQMYTIMLQHSSNLFKSLQKKLEDDEVIDTKAWVLFSFFLFKDDVFLLYSQLELHDCLFCRAFAPYSMDVVASTAFSVDIDSINHPADPFLANIKKFAKFDFFNPLLVLVGMSNMTFTRILHLVVLLALI